MLKRKYLSLVLLVLMVTLTLITGCGSNNTVSEETSTPTTLKIANYYATDHPVNVHLNEVFKKIVEEQTEGSIKVEVYPNNQLGDEQEFVEGVQIGTVEMAMTGNLWENTIPEFRIMQMPYMFVSYDHANEVLNGPIGQEIFEYIKPLDVKILASFPNGFRAISNNVRPINTLEDTRGINLRVFQGETIIDLMNELGFNTTVMSIAEIFTSLQQGVVDGQDNPVPSSYYSGYYEVQKYVAVTNHMYSPGYVVINNDVWNSLTEEEQAIVEEAAGITSVKIKESIVQQDEEIIELIQEEGIVVTYPELQPFMERVSPIIDEYIEAHPHTETTIRKIQELAENYL